MKNIAFIRDEWNQIKYLNDDTNAKDVKNRNETNIINILIQ